MAHVITFEDDITSGDTGNGAGLFDDDDPFSLPPPLPPLSPEPNEQANQDGANAKGESKDEKEKEKKKVKRSPQPKLDAVRLCCDRGLPALIHLCDDIKFKGKGHEASDLKLLLQRYEHWAHRLFPKFPFMDVVDQVEILGNKKLVQNCVKRIRRGEQETVADDDNSDTEIAQNIESQDSAHPSQTAATPAVNAIQSFGGQVETPDRMIMLTPEQQERIRLNRETALSRRKAALEKASKDISSQNDNPAEDLQAAEDVKDKAINKQHRIKDHCLMEGDIEMEDDADKSHGGRTGEALLCDEETTVGSLMTSTVCNNENYEGKNLKMSPAAQVAESQITKAELPKEALEVNNHSIKNVVESDVPGAGDVLRNEVVVGLDYPPSSSDISVFQRSCSTESTGTKQTSTTHTTEQIPDEQGLGVVENDMDQPMEMER